MKRFAIINGPNLNLTGKRETEIYGHQGFDRAIGQISDEPGIMIDYFQSNHEGELVEQLQRAAEDCNGVVLNAGGYTHTSVAIADAVRSLDIPVVEVHLSNIFAREDYRHVSLAGPHCAGVIAGFGMDSYRLAILQLIRISG